MIFKVFDVIISNCMLDCFLFLLDSLSLGPIDAPRRGSCTPQPQRAMSASLSLSQRSQSFDRLNDPAIYSEIPSSSNSYLASPLASGNSSVMSPPLVHNSTPPPPIGYNSAPPPPPPPVHKAKQPIMPPKEIEVHPEGPPSYHPAMTDIRRYSGVDWHSDLKEKLRKRAESVGNCSPKRPATPLDDQMYVEVVPPFYIATEHHALSTSSSPPVTGTNQDRFSMTPPVTPPIKRSETHVPPPCLPKPSKAIVSSSHDRNSDEDDVTNDSPFAKALKTAKLKKVASNDRSAPRV